MDGSTPARPLTTPRRRTIETERRRVLLSRVSDVILDEGFTTVTVDDLARRLECSKATLYGIAGSKTQLVIMVTKRFFESATREIEAAVAEIGDHADRINAYLRGVGTAMSSLSPAFYRDMVAYSPTADLYQTNSLAAARRSRELIEEGVRSGQFRAVDASFAGHLIAMAIEGIQSGRLLDASGLTAGQAFSELGDILVRGLKTPSRA